ncbi:MAG TPA: 1-acyl-sn-glycerol-3-phosphate acyltransferase [Clostridiaceae bacterium]|nr:1-acyl-sn-glycerol-3-phosphate acyltransferase [Clostridiaceae bacterium]
MKGLLRYGLIYNLFKIILRQIVKVKFNYTYEKVIPRYKPYIVLSNHTTNYDPIMIGLSFPGLLYYVASDHIFRLGILSKLLVLLADPIPRLKATAETQAVKQILKRIKAGGSVCIFAEGNRSFSGETVDIPESTGKLIKLSGAALITYRLDGGYFSSPRWSKTLRRGSMTGRKVREYSPEEIKAMTVDEINMIIKNDLYVNAYEENKRNPIAFHGKKLAENLETALYLCPMCGEIATLKSENDRFHCSCGLSLKYTPYGKFVADGNSKVPFETVLDWSNWQSEKIKELAQTYNKLSPDKLIFCDEGQSLFEIDKASKSNLVDKGKLCMYNNRLVFYCENGDEYNFYFEKISDMAIHGQMVLIFSTTDHKSFEIRSNHPRSAVKYLDVYRELKTRGKAEE